MPLATTLYNNFVGSNPCHGRVIKTVPGGIDRAQSADPHASVIGFGYGNALGSALTVVNVGQVWAVELYPMAPDVVAAGVDMMVLSDGICKGREPGDSGLCIGQSAMWPSWVPVAHRNYTFSALGKRFVWILCAPSTVA